MLLRRPRIDRELKSAIGKDDRKMGAASDVHGTSRSCEGIIQSIRNYEHVCVILPKVVCEWRMLVADTSSHLYRHPTDSLGKKLGFHVRPSVINSPSR